MDKNIDVWSNKIHELGPIVVLCFLLAIQLSINIQDVNKFSTLPSYDSYYLLEYTKSISNNGDITFDTPNTYTSTPIVYPTSYVLLYSLLKLFTNVELETIYRYGGPFQFSFMLLCIYLLIRKCINNGSFALIGTLLFASIPYNLYRSTMPLPEGLALAFQVLIFLVLIMNKLPLERKLLLVALFLSGATYIHYRSIIVPIILIISYISLKYISDKCNKKLAILFVSGLVLYLLTILPIIQFVVNQYLYYASPAQYEWKEIEFVQNRYDLLQPEDYIDQFGLLPLILVFLGIVYLLYNYRKNSDNVAISVWFVFTLILTQSLRFGFYAPPYRFYPYLAIPFSIVATIGFTKLFTNLKRIIIRPLLVLVILLLSITVIINYAENNSHKIIFVGFQQSDIEAAEFLKKQLDNSSVVISYGAFSIHMGIPRSEGRYETLHEIFLSTDPLELNNTLSRLYPDEKNVYIYLIKNMNEPMDSKYPRFNSVLKNYSIIFNKKGTQIYKLK